MKIRYEFANGEVSEVDVSEEIGAMIMELDRQESNVNHKETRRHCSLEAYNPDDILLPADADVAGEVVRADEAARLHATIKKLKPCHQRLIH